MGWPKKNAESRRACKADLVDIANCTRFPMTRRFNAIGGTIENQIQLKAAKLNKTEPI